MENSDVAGSGFAGTAAALYTWFTRSFPLVFEGPGSGGTRQGDVIHSLALGVICVEEI